MNLLISESDFQNQFGEKYEALKKEAQFFISNPDALRLEIEQENRKKSPEKLSVPMPDPFIYRMTKYRGYLRFPDRLKNYVVSLSDSRQKTRRHWPTMMDVEPTSRCNFRCTMCTVSEWENGKRAEDLKLADFKKLLDSQPFICDLKIQGLGEPLLNPDFIPMIEDAVSRDIWTRTTVNGSLLHGKDNIRRLIDSGIGEVQNSFDGATKEVFESIRRRSKFDQVVKNLTELNRYANKKDRPYTRMWALIQKTNRHQIFEFVELAKQMEFRRMTFSISLGDWGKSEWNKKTGEMSAPGLSCEEEAKLSELSKTTGIEITAWGSVSSCSTESADRLCGAPFNRTFVSSDLKVVCCSRICNPEVMSLGDGKNFQDQWNGPAYQEFRQAHLDAKIPEYCRACYGI